MADMEAVIIMAEAMGDGTADRRTEDGGQWTGKTSKPKGEVRRANRRGN